MAARCICPAGCSVEERASYQPSPRTQSCMGKNPTVTVTHQPLPACSSSLRLPPHASASALYPQALSLLLLLPTTLETCRSLCRSPPASMA
ncbi:uncharacterized [Tachysurus ichikawai]